MKGHAGGIEVKIHVGGTEVKSAAGTKVKGHEGFEDDETIHPAGVSK